MHNTTRELVGVSVALAVGQAVHAGTAETVGLAVAALYGSRLPDVDQLGSRIHRRGRLERRSLLIGSAGAVGRFPLVLFAASAGIGL